MATTTLSSPISAPSVNVETQSATVNANVVRIVTASGAEQPVTGTPVGGVDNNECTKLLTAQEIVKTKALFYVLFVPIALILLLLIFLIWLTPSLFMSIQTPNGDAVDLSGFSAGKVPATPSPTVNTPAPANIKVGSSTFNLLGYNGLQGDTNSATEVAVAGSKAKARILLLILVVILALFSMVLLIMFIFKPSWFVRTGLEKKKEDLKEANKLPA